MGELHPYDALKRIVVPIFDSAGLNQQSEQYSPDVFGSAYSVFGTDRPRFCLIWDGKDGRGFVQQYSSEGKWEDIPIYLTGGDIEARGANQGKIESLKTRLQQLAGTESSSH